MARWLLVVVAAAMATAVQPDVPQREEFFYTVQLVSRFPSQYFDQNDRLVLHQVVLTRWPGPSGLLRLWREGQLQEVHRVALLLGGAAFHDPQLLPIYIEGLKSGSQRVRQAAAYGYRDLLADYLPTVAGGVDDAAAAALATEVSLMMETLRQRPLTAVWLDAYLLPRQRHLPGSVGIVPRRNLPVCLRALDTVLRPEDLPLLVAALAECETRGTRAPLVPLVEAITLKSFRREPRPGKPWGTEVYRNAVSRMDRWLTAQCELDFESVLRGSLTEYGAVGVDPMSPEAFWVWYGVLQGRKSSWWPLAARELYRNGAPPAFPSALLSGGEAGEQQRDRLLEQLRTVPTRDELMRRSRGRRPPPPQAPQSDRPR